jgi:hypothetical protein
MKKTIIILFLFLFSCKKENYDVTFLDFGYCRTDQGILFKFKVDETISVESYTLEGTADLRKFIDLGQVKSKKVVGPQMYEISAGKNRSIFYRVRANHRNKYVQYSENFSF